MKMPEQLNRCPITPECTAKKLFTDGEGNIFRLDTHKQEFVPHTCRSRGSEIPKVFYMGVWFNKATERIRYTGPYRMKKSAEVPPNDPNYKKRGDNPVWVLKDVQATDARWKSANKEQ